MFKCLVAGDCYYFINYGNNERLNYNVDTVKKRMQLGGQVGITGTLQIPDFFLVFLFMLVLLTRVAITDMTHL